MKLTRTLIAAAVGAALSFNALAAERNIIVLTAAEDHGWTGSVATFAKQKAAEINQEGRYGAEVITCDSAGYQINQIEDILARGDKSLAGIVIQPIDDTVMSGLQQIVNAEIPYVDFDRIIDGVSDKAVSNVKGDNEGIGAGAAAYFVSKGLKPGDKVYVYEGDTSSVTTLRNLGFTKYLTGQLAFNGEKIPDNLKWTEDQVKKSLTYSGATNWSRSNTKTSFESLLGEASNADIRWIYAEDDELAMGILEALRGGGIDDDIKERFLSHQPVITGCGGLEELYSVLRGEEYQDLYKKLGGLMSVTYSPSMIQTAEQDMVDFLDGKAVTQDHVIECHNVTADNVGSFKSFN
ncbi:MAG: substrate-binding domain-containing protein [Succinivibrio sp.]|nr:substrate-binding domain-containing protein [Succinivibrio sp.]